MPIIVNLDVMMAKRKISLNELLKGINKNNLHKEDDFTPEGNEVW